MTETADSLFVNGRIHTMDATDTLVEAIAVRDGRIIGTGTDAEVLRHRGPSTQVVDLLRHTVIPGLVDSHIHVIRGGLTYNTELRWEGVRSVADALEMLRVQADRTPAPQWIRVIGGWTEYQFCERRLPTLEEINEAAPDTPVFILHLYSHAMLNRAALRALGYDRNIPEFDRGVVQTDARGVPTGMLVAKPSALILYKSLASAPALSAKDQLNSSRQFMRELNRLGMTSAIDAGGGGQNYPDDYAIVHELRDANQMTLRIAYNLFAQVPGKELEDFRRWVDMTKPGQGDAMLKVLGAGENLVWSAADFENFLEPRPDLNEGMESQLEAVISLLAERRWPFRIHATYDESIERFLNVFERVSERIPFDGLRFVIDHAET
ncbi:MAG: amidohydrolase, partial [Myxococcota bacterium]